MAGVLRYVVLLCLIYLISGNEDEDDPAKRQPSPCEVCKYLVTELNDRLTETDRKEVLHVGHGLDPKKKKDIKYKTSETRLIEALQEPHICDRIIEYNVHAERKGSLRYAKGMSETMQTLHGLVDKGVKVELGMPYEMWDKPSAEVTHMQRKCYKMVEDYEDEIEEWYYNHQDKDLANWLCSQRILKKEDDNCLSESFVPSENEDNEGSEDARKGGKEKKKKKKKKNLKGDPGGNEDKSKEKKDKNKSTVDNKDEL